MIKLNVAGVPEHFNFPWHTAIESGDFAKAGFEVNWTDYPGGTGAMMKSLRSGESDVAVVLTGFTLLPIRTSKPSNRFKAASTRSVARDPDLI